MYTCMNYAIRNARKVYESTLIAYKLTKFARWHYIEHAFNNVTTIDPLSNRYVDMNYNRLTTRVIEWDLC